MENNWLNPLSPDESYLISLSTGTVASSAMVKDLPRALEVGEEAYQTFEGTGLDDDPPSVKFHDKMTKQRLKTFSTIRTFLNERPKCGSEGRPKPLQLDDPGS